MWPTYLRTLTFRKATGPDGISPRLLKEVGNAISKPLSKLFNLSLEIKTILEVWKRANVIPIYKKGEKTNINNYRPISLLSCVRKLCERVVFKYTTEWGNIKAGMPQGSVLGPLLFLIYINYITEDVVSNIRLFADDTSLFINIDDPTASARLMNNNLEKINQWSARWLVSFSAEKTKSMTISNKNVPVHHPPLYFDGEEIIKVDRHKHLGITLSSDLTWQSHVDDIVSKADTKLNIMSRLYYLLYRKTLETMYTSFVRPTLEYGDTIWCNLTEAQSQQIEQVQKWVGRIVSGAT